MPDPCDKCGKNPGREYAFYYGKLVSEELVESTVRSKTYREQYTVGRGTAVICDSCIAQAHRFARVRIAVGIVLLLIAVGASMAVEQSPYEGGWDVPAFLLISLAMLIGLFGLIAGGLVRLTRGHDRIGEEMALGLHRAALAKSYDSFWSETEYKELGYLGPEGSYSAARPTAEPASGEPAPVGSEARIRVVAGLCPKCGNPVAAGDQNCPSCRISLAQFS